jgi:hypothetical protein
MDHMDFLEIRRLVSGDQIVLEYLWNKLGATICPSYSSFDFYCIGRSRV